MRVYRASSLGYSLEQLVAPHLGYSPVDPPEVIQRAYDEGHRLEPVVIAKLMDAGWEIRIRQDEINNIGDYQIECELEIIPGAAKVVGHLDGIRERAEGRTIVEIKSMAHRAWMQFNDLGWDAPGLVQKYKWQASCYMLATGLPHCMIAYDKETGKLAFRTVEEPFYLISDIANKVLAAEQCIRDGALPEGCEDYPCSYFYLHPAKDAVPVDKADDDLEVILSAWLEADKVEKAAKKAKDGLREQIMALASNEPGVGKIKGACGVTVTTTSVEEKNVSYVSKAHWETRVQGPRNGK